MSNVLSCSTTSILIYSISTADATTFDTSSPYFVILVTFPVLSRNLLSCKSNTSLWTPSNVLASFENASLPVVENKSYPNLIPLIFDCALVMNDDKNVSFPNIVCTKSSVALSIASSDVESMPSVTDESNCLIIKSLPSLSAVIIAISIRLLSALSSASYISDLAFLNMALYVSSLK